MIATERRYVVAAFAAVLLLIVAWTVLHLGFYARNHVIDTPIYQRYGDSMVEGEVPYRDFAVEYPPGALPAFVLPALVQQSDDESVTPGFRRTFETLMWLCGALALLAGAATLRALDAPIVRVAGALGLAALAPLALGSIVLTRFDLWPTAIVAGAVAALAYGRIRLGSALLGLGAAVKIFPAALLPLALVLAWKRDGRRAALECLGVALAVMAAAFVPFVVLSPHGVWHSLHDQLSRPLQVESLGSSLLLAAHHVGGLDLTERSSHGSQNLGGDLPTAVAAVSTAVQALALLSVWVVFARRPATGERIVAASAAVLAAFIAFGKVLSPQFVIWLIPIVPLVRSRVAAALLVAALVLTQLWFPFHYWQLALDFRARESWLVLARNLALVALFGVLLRHVHAHRLARRRAAVRAAIDEQALDANVA